MVKGVIPFGFLNKAAPPPPIQYIYVVGGNESTNVRTARTDRLNIANNSVSTFNLYRRAGLYTDLQSATHGFFSTWNSFFSFFPGNPSNSAYSAIVFATQTFVAQGLVTISDTEGIGCVNTSDYGFHWQRRSNNSTIIGAQFNYSSNSLIGTLGGLWDGNRRNAGRLPYTSTATSTKSGFGGYGSSGLARFRVDVIGSGYSFINNGFTAVADAVQGSNAINSPSAGYRHFSGTKGLGSTTLTFSNSTETIGGIALINGAAFNQTGYTATTGYLFKSDTNSGREVHVSSISTGSTFSSLGALCTYTYQGYSVMQDTGIQ